MKMIEMMEWRRCLESYGPAFFTTPDKSSLTIFTRIASLLLILQVAIGCSSTPVRTPAEAPPEEKIVAVSPTALTSVAAKKCPRYQVYYIDPSTQFFTPPVPIEDHAEFVFCATHENLDEIRSQLKKMKPIGSHADAGAGRIKVVPRGRPEEAFIFCSTGEITYRGKQFRLDRRAYEPALVSLQEEGDRQRALAIEKEADLDPRNPASSSP